MVLIISQEADLNTIDVVKWLLYYKVPYIRIDRESVIELKEISIRPNGEYKLILRDIKRDVIIDFSKIHAYWYRRGEINFEDVQLEFLENIEVQLEMKYFLKVEQFKIIDFIHYVLDTKRRICSFRQRDLNKLHVLLEAAKMGLSIATTQVVTTPSDIEIKNAITKCITNPFRVTVNGVLMTTYTESADYNNWPKKFFPTLVQSHIVKEADIRIFYLLGEFYSMAIMSQSHEQTKTDFRKYLLGFGNRKFPFTLPESIKELLHALMSKLQLQTGSIDMILTRTGEFVFLEINPIGQFGMTSKPCNYYLNRRIAQQLMNLDQP